MAIVMMIVALLTAQDFSTHHVRTHEARIDTLLQIGIAQSPTFRRLVEALDDSDVIVYIRPKVTRQRLGGYLAHNVSVGGSYRYLYIALGMQGADARVIAILAHELRHALEVAEHADARDPDSVERLFTRLAIQEGCGAASCFETAAALDVELAVRAELANAR